jgi:glycosyltransferase involved in cell wall biosynthesis
MRRPSGDDNEFSRVRRQDLTRVRSRPMGSIAAARSSRHDAATPLRPLVVFVAPSIPPVHGMSLVAHRAGERVAAAGCKSVWLSRNPPGLQRGLMYFLGVIQGLVRSMWRAGHLRRSGTKSIYVACSGGLGQLAEGLCVAMLRRRADPLVVHHHNFGYLKQRSAVFKFLLRTVYRSAHHVVLCDRMAELLARQGVDGQRITVVSNATFIDEPGFRPRDVPIRSRLRLGHLSNLSIDKGLRIVLDVLEDSPDDVVMVLYGRTSDPLSAEVLEHALARFPDRLEHVEPTDRASVWNFYHGIDLFLFPSRNDAAPLVVLEALAAGTPVLASDSGCIPSQLSPALADFSVDLEAFRSRARQVIDRMSNEVEYRRQLSATATLQWTQLRSTSTAQFEEIVALLTSPPGAVS